MNPLDSIEVKIARSLDMLNDAIEKFNPKMVVGLMSGGNDSVPACYIASLHPRFSGILHCNTGIGIEQTRDHVRNLCADRGWRLWEYLATENVNAKGEFDPMDYDAIVLKHGFPGPFAHGAMYSKLKERSIRRFKRDAGASSHTPIMFVSGARQDESRRRARANYTAYKSGSEVWVSVIYKWLKQDCSACRVYAKIPINPVTEKLGMSGECLCGAFVKRGELDRIHQHYPQVGMRILNLERRVKAAGFPWGWEDERPPSWWLESKKGQQFLFEMGDPAIHKMPLCQSCVLTQRRLPPEVGPANAAQAYPK